MSGCQPSRKRYPFAPSADTWVEVMTVRAVDVVRSCRFEIIFTRRLLKSFRLANGVPEHLAPDKTDGDGLV